MSDPGRGWLNRTVIGAGLTSFLADVGYELATALMVPFLLVLNLTREQASQALGFIEATAEFLSNTAKLGIGWYSDTIGRRKAFVVTGYALTGTSFGLCALAVGWPLILAAKGLAWLGKGIRGPLRNAILADAVDPADRGKAFGLHRAGDTLGAVVGPLLGWALLRTVPAESFPDASGPYRLGFLLTLIPGLGAAVTFAWLIREQRLTPKPGLRLGASIRQLPDTYRRFLIAVLLFGMGDIAPTFLILAATTSLAGTFGLQSATEAAMLLYAWRNFIQALAAFPAGWLGDSVGRLPVLIVGYLVGAAGMIGFLVASEQQAEPMVWAALFGIAGIYMAVQESLEPALVPDFVPDPAIRGTAFGVLATVNGLGDVAASLTVGTLYATLGPGVALGFAAGMMSLGSVGLLFVKPTQGSMTS